MGAGSFIAPSIPRPDGETCFFESLAHEMQGMKPGRCDRMIERFNVLTDKEPQQQAPTWGQDSADIS